MSFFERVIEALEEADVRYVVVGGLAVVLHGHPRLTVDLDLVVDLEPREARKALDALLSLGLVPVLPVDPLGFADPSTRSRWVEERNMRVFSLRDPNDELRRVDLFVEEPVDFSSLWERSVVLALERTRVRVAAISDLIAMKRDAGRLLDLADIEALETIVDERRDG